MFSDKSLMSGVLGKSDVDRVVVFATFPRSKIQDFVSFISHPNVCVVQSRRHGGALVGLSPQTKR